MRISLVNLNCGGQGLSSATTAIQQSTDSEHARHSTLDQKHQRGLVLEHWVPTASNRLLGSRYLQAAAQCLAC